jgi:hypothetical protein
MGDRGLSDRFEQNFNYDLTFLRLDGLESEIFGIDSG